MSRATRWLAFGLLVGLTLADRASGQTTYTWNSAGTDWATASNWSPAGVPDSPDTVLFNPNGALMGTSPQNPNITGSRGVFAITIAPNQQMGGWNFTGDGTLAIGGSASTGLTTYGPGTYVFDGPTLQGASSVGLLNLTVTTGSTLTFAGNTTAVTNLGTIQVNGGTLRLDNSSTMLSRLANNATANIVNVTGGGTFELIGGSAAFTQNVGNLASVSTATYSQSGFNSIKVTPNGSSTVLNFANSGTTRPGLGAVYQFVAGGGNLGDADGARVTFAGTPNLGVGGLLANTNGATVASVGFATVKDSLGTNWATWTAGTGIISVANPNSGATITTVSDAAGLATLTSSSLAQFNPAGGTTITASGAVTAAAFRITPAGSGSSLAMGASALTTNALMLDGANDFAITGTANFGGAAPHYIYVNNPFSTLSLGLVVANGGNPTVFAGPGFVDLTSSGSQNTLSSAIRFVIAGGVVRGNNAQIGFSSSGAGLLAMAGGVLEIKGGSNGLGSAADFTRPIGTAKGNVNWGTITSGDAGSGGFSAFGSNASVNLGGLATPANLQWGQTSFVADGYALKFGSSQSNAVLTFLNPLQLDNGGRYQVREVQVVGGTGGDRTVFAGVISGAANSDLLKTGSGTLELTAANTFSGNTLIAAGTLVASNPSGSATGTGVVNIYNGGTLRGTGTVSGNSDNGAINVAGGGTLAPGGLVNTGVLTVNNSVSFAGGSSANFNLRANGNTVGNGTSTSGYDQLAMTAGVLDLNNATLNLAVGYTPTVNSDALLIINNADDAVGLNGTFNGLPDGAVFTAGGVGWQIFYGNSADAHGGSAANDVVLVAVPVPEPGTLLAVGLAAVGLAGLARRLRRRNNEDSNA